MDAELHTSSFPSLASVLTRLIAQPTVIWPESDGARGIDLLHSWRGEGWGGAQVYNPRIWEVEDKGARVQGHPTYTVAFEASPSYSTGDPVPERKKEREGGRGRGMREGEKEGENQPLEMIGLGDVLT